MSERVIVNDVGPRDGLQNQPRVLEPLERLRLIRALLEAGLRHVEVGSFVSPKAVPAMAGAAEVMSGLPDVPGACFTALVPNLKGYELATAAGARSVSLVLYGTESMAQKNVRMGKLEAEAVNADILRRARQENVRVTATISVAFVCPFEGAVEPDVVAKVVADFLVQGADEVSVADTIGAAHPGQVRAMMDRLVREHGPACLSCHFHDTRALGLANVFAALESGIRKFDASIGGLGGCPFAPGASGNVATEDVVLLLRQMGFETGIDLARLLAAADLARQLTGTAPLGRTVPWLRRDLERQAAACERVGSRGPKF